jgi:hypothetical protein
MTSKTRIAAPVYDWRLSAGAKDVHCADSKSLERSIKSMEGKGFSTSSSSCLDSKRFTSRLRPADFLNWAAKGGYGDAVVELKEVPAFPSANVLELRLFGKGSKSKVKLIWDSNGNLGAQGKVCGVETKEDLVRKLEAAWDEDLAKALLLPPNPSRSHNLGTGGTEGRRCDG